jgi:WD40 repeat protein
VWDTAAGAELLTLRGHTGEVYSAAYSADGRSIVSGSVDQTLIVWDATTGEIVRRFGETGERHTDFVTAVAFSPDGSEIVSGSVDRTVRLWDVASGQPIRVDTGYGDTITGLRFSADGGQVYVVSRGGDLRVLPASPAAYAAWVRDHRAVRALTCEEQTFYGLGACP